MLKEANEIHQSIKEIWQSGRVVSLWDMIRSLDLNLLIGAYDLLCKAKAIVDHGRNLNPAICLVLKGMLNQATGELAKLVGDLSVKDRLIKDLLKGIEDNPEVDTINRNMISSEIQAIQEITIHVLHSRRCFILPIDAHKYVDDTSLRLRFLTNSIFEQSGENLVQAQHCIAHGNYTAAVYHCLCVLDRALPKLKELAVLFTGEQIADEVLEKSWGVILNKLEGVVSKARGGNKHSKLVEISTLRRHMSDIQFSKRDRRMHADGSDNEEEAVAFFDNTCRLIEYIDSL